MSTAVLSRRIATPRLRGRSRLPIVEPNKDDLLAPYKRISRPAHSWPPDAASILTTTFGHAKAELSFSEWQLFHAAAKTELAYLLPGEDVLQNAYGAWLQNGALLKWRDDNLRLAASGIFSRKDSSRTAIAGRFGEAVMYLYMVDQGYIYWDHLPFLVERAMTRLKYPREEQLRVAKAVSRPAARNGKQPKQPDYAFENAILQVALAEAKGSFVAPEENATVKGGLSGGLAQISLWQPCIEPKPDRCFAVGTYLREEDDRHPDPSLVAVVDPPGDGEPEFRPVELPHQPEASARNRHQPEASARSTHQPEASAMNKGAHEPARLLRHRQICRPLSSLTLRVRVTKPTRPASPSPSAISKTCWRRRRR